MWLPRFPPHKNRGIFFTASEKETKQLSLSWCCVFILVFSLFFSLGPHTTRTIHRFAQIATISFSSPFSPFLDLHLEMLQLGALSFSDLFFSFPFPLGVVHALLNHVGGGFVHAGADLGLFAVKGGREAEKEGG